MLNIYYSPAGSGDVLGCEFAKALDRHLPVALVPTHKDSQGMLHDRTNFRELHRSARPDAVTLNLADWRNSKRLPGRPVISYIAWETTRIPGRYRRKLLRLPHIWVPSRWQKQVFIKNGLEGRRIDVVPEGFDPQLFYPPAAAEHTRRPFRFLFVGKWEVRKGVRELLQAFTREFDQAEPVELLLAAHNPFRPELDPALALQQSLQSIGAINTRIRCLPHMNRSELAELYRSVDAFVLPTRGEGWGLPLLEAMASGLPCIVTNYSGLTEFATDDSVCFLNHWPCLVPVWDPRFFKHDWYWGRWARPSVRHLRQLMRKLYEEPDTARRVGEKAARVAHDHWTWDHAARKAVVRLNELAHDI